MQIEPEDSFEAVLIALHLQSEPIILLLPEQSRAFSDPSHFARLQEVCPPINVSFVIPRNRLGTLARHARQHGFAFTSSLQKATQLLPAHEKEQVGTSQSQRAMVSPAGQMTNESSDISAVVVENEQGADRQQAATTQWPPQPVTPLPESLSSTYARAHLKRSGTRHVGLILTLVALLLVASAIVLPVLFSQQTGLMGTTQPAVTQATSVGQVTFTSSGQLDPGSSKGLNDTVTVSLHNLSTPALGKSYFAWLLPDSSDDNTLPLLLGKLAITGGKAQLTYVHPNHDDLLASYSGLRVTEQPSDQVPITPPLDPKTWHYVGSIPTIPTPGDEKQYSLLDHTRHLLAKDPTLQQIGLAGGLDIWLYRNTEKVLEWSSAARDSWAGGQQTDLIHRHMIRVLDYLDGAAYVYNSGDLPPGSPLLVDPQAGRIGLLEVSPTQQLPGYLTHVDIHLQGVMNAPGHTPGQRQLAIKIDPILKQVTSLMQKIHQDAVTLVKMDDTQLQSQDALTLLNDMVTNATSAYVGQFDPATGGNINGVIWIHNELQGLATIPVTTLTVGNTSSN